MDLKKLQTTLETNQDSLSNALLLHFTSVLADMPSCAKYGPAWRQTFNSGQGTVAVGNLLQHVTIGEDEDLWFEFLKALNKRLPAHRRKFISDAEWKSMETQTH